MQRWAYFNKKYKTVAVRHFQNICFWFNLSVQPNTMSEFGTRLQFVQPVANRGSVWGKIDIIFANTFDAEIAHLILLKCNTKVDILKMSKDLFGPCNKSQRGPVLFGHSPQT